MYVVTMMTDDDEIEQSLRRVAAGEGNGLDQWRARAAERQEQREIVQKDMRASELDMVRKINDDALTADEQGWAEATRDAMGEAIATLRDDFRVMSAEHVDALSDEIARDVVELRKEAQTLREQIAELRGELRGMRSGRILKPGD
jgi:hypothetical protein